MENQQKYLLTCAPGIEELFSEELTEILALENSLPTNEYAAIRVDLTEEQLLSVILHSKLCARVLLPIAEFASASEAMLYDQVRRIDWREYFSTEQTFAVFSHGDLGVPHIAQQILPLKIKDAICDEFRKKGSERPNVDRHEPDVRIEAHFRHKRCELSLDLLGYPLHRRSYRSGAKGAPLREDKASALLRFAQIPEGALLIDAFCGTGTLAIEAALKSAGFVAEALDSSRWKPLASYYPQLWKDWLRQGPELNRIAAEKAPQSEILAYDISKKAVEGALEHAKRAGVSSWIKFSQQDSRELVIVNAHFVANPPFGQRLGEEAKAAEDISAFVRQLKHHCSPCQLSMILPKGALPKAVGLKAARKCNIENSKLSCLFLHYSIFSGRLGDLKARE